MNSVLHPSRLFFHRGSTRGFMLGAVLLLAFTVRLAAARGPLWLDEIWSLELARQAATPAAVLTDLKSDNNHILNTLYLQAVRATRSPVVVRLPAIFCGTLCVGLAFGIARTWGSVEAVLATAFVTHSYLMIHYASEARGYAPALATALLAWFALQRYFDSGARHWTVVLWGACILGLLAHPIFSHFLVAAALWSATVVGKQVPSRRTAVRTLATLFALPFSMAAALYIAQWRAFELGGGPPLQISTVLLQSASLTLGGPVHGGTPLLFAACVLALVAAAGWTLRHDPQHAGLLLILLVLCPIGLALAVRPAFLFPRYFLIAMLVVPFALSVVISRWFRGGTIARALAASCVLLFLAGNLRHTRDLIATGRGQYPAALAHMLARSPGPEVLLSSDHNFGVRKLVEFHAAALPDGARLRYCDGNQWPATGPDWLILHRAAESVSAAPPAALSADGHHFRLDRAFDCAILSGWQWWCYRRADAARTPTPPERDPSAATARQDVRPAPMVRTVSFVGRVVEVDRGNGGSFGGWDFE